MARLIVGVVLGLTLAGCGAEPGSDPGDATAAPGASPSALPPTSSPSTGADTAIGDALAFDLRSAIEDATTTDPVVDTSRLVSALEVIDLGRSYMALWTPVPDATGFQVSRLGAPMELLGPDAVSFSWLKPGVGDILGDLGGATISAQFVFVHAMDGDQILHTFVGSVGCPNWAFIAARGSGQNLPDWSSYSRAMGSRGFAVWEQVRDRAGLDPDQLPAVAVDYPAVGVGYEGGSVAVGNLPQVYNDSVGVGVAAARLAILRTLTACGNTRLILFGYSQGAQVMGDAYASLIPAARARVGMLVLFADPLYTPGDPAVAYLPTPHNASGIKGERAAFGPADGTLVQSWCASNDGVCQRPPAGYLPHGSAYDDYEREAASTIADVIGQTEPLWSP